MRRDRDDHPERTSRRSLVLRVTRNYDRVRSVLPAQFGPEHTQREWTGALVDAAAFDVSNVVISGAARRPVNVA
jgi:hypothetical protein